MHFCIGLWSIISRLLGLYDESNDDVDAFLLRLMYYAKLIIVYHQCLFGCSGMLWSRRHEYG